MKIKPIAGGAIIIELASGISLEIYDRDSLTIHTPYREPTWNGRNAWDIGLSNDRLVVDGHVVQDLIETTVQHRSHCGCVRGTRECKNHP